MKYLRFIEDDTTKITKPQPTQETNPQTADSMHKNRVKIPK